MIEFPIIQKASHEIFSFVSKLAQFREISFSKEATHLPITVDG